MTQTSTRSPGATSRRVPPILAPTPDQMARSTLFTILLICISLLLGWGVKTMAQTASHEIPLAESLPGIRYPARWIADQPEEMIARIADPQSTSPFSTRVEVTSRPLWPGESWQTLSTSWPLERRGTLSDYRILSMEALTGPQARPALLINYGYVVDPTQETGIPSLPVAVQAQDLLFLVTEDGQEKLMVITLAADTSEWQQVRGTFSRILAHLEVHPSE